MTTQPTPGREALLRPQLARVARLLHKAETGDVTAVHQARVASRRLRELLPILELDPRVSRKLGRRLRKVTRALGPVRELDVLLTLGRDWDAATPRERRARSGRILRGYGSDDRIVYGTGIVVPNSDIEAQSAAILGRGDVAYVHMRSAANNCFTLRIDRG